MTDKAMELITVNVTAPGAGAAMAAVAGNSLTIRNSKKAEMLALWGNRQVDGLVRVTSPLMHDAVVGAQLRMEAGDTRGGFLPAVQPMTSQDTLSVVGVGSAVGGEIETNSYLIYYEDLAGICGNFIDADELDARAEDLYAPENSITTGVAGGYSGQQSIIQIDDQLKANRDYAIVGMSMTSVGASVACAVRYLAPDWGNLGIGLPASLIRPEQGLTFFKDLSLRTDKATIPVFNASNKDSVFVDIAGNENATTFLLVTNMVLLSKTKTRRRR